MMQFILDNFRLTPEEEAAFEELNRQAYYEELKIEKRKMAKELRKEITTKVRKEISAQEMAKGKKEKNEIIKALYQKNIPFETIADVCKISKQEIMKIVGA